MEHATSVTILNIEAILKEDVAIDRLEMETEDGEIYDLYRRDNGMELIVIWNEYQPLRVRPRSCSALAEPS